MGAEMEPHAKTRAEGPEPVFFRTREKRFGMGSSVQDKALFPAETEVAISTMRGSAEGTTRARDATETESGDCGPPRPSRLHFEQSDRPFGRAAKKGRFDSSRIGLNDLNDPGGAARRRDPSC